MVDYILKLPFAKNNNRTVLKFGFIISTIIVLFQVANHLVIYNYLKLDYYLSLVAIIFLIIGLLLKEKKEIIREIPVEIVKEIYLTSAVYSDNLNKLTSKELQILKFIIHGKSNKEIAEINFVEISTIKTHINNLYAKLSVKNRKEASLQYAHLIENQ